MTKPILSKPSATMHLIRHVVMACLLISILGCGESFQRPKMTIHIHDGQYDFIDFKDVVVESADDIEGFQKVIRKPEFQGFVQRNAFVLRFAEPQSSMESGYPDEVAQAMSKLAEVGVTYYGLDIIDE